MPPTKTPNRLKLGAKLVLLAKNGGVLKQGIELAFVF
jgi:hypothetical protein